jgi:glycosyltransferase involved in cell wall biosynthesis
MLGRHPGYITTQAQRLADLFAAEGMSVAAASPIPNRYARLAHTVAALLRHLPASDVVIIDVFSGPAFGITDVASFVTRLFHRPMILCLRGGGLPEFAGRFPSWTRRVLARATVLVAPSQFLAREMVRAGLNIRVVPNVIELAKYPYRHREQLSPRLLWMRSFHPLYNPEMAVRVVARLRGTFPDATLTMAGRDKGSEQATRELARSLGVIDAVKFAGFLDVAGKATAGSAADIFINTNHVDNTPVAVIEACAMGIPVVATAAGGIGDLLSDAVTGLIVADDDDRQMADAVVNLLRCPQLAGMLSRNGRALAERCDWNHVLPMWQELFSALCKPAVVDGHALDVLHPGHRV